MRCWSLVARCRCDCPVLGFLLQKLLATPWRTKWAVNSCCAIFDHSIQPAASFHAHGGLGAQKVEMGREEAAPKAASTWRVPFSLLVVSTESTLSDNCARRRVIPGLRDSSSREGSLLLPASHGARAAQHTYTSAFATSMPGIQYTTKSSMWSLFSDPNTWSM